MSAVNEDVPPIQPSLSHPTKKARKWLPCDPADPATKFVRIALQDRLRNVPELLKQVIALGSNEPDCVRKLRVATRRATTAVNLFSEFATPATTSRVSRDLKKIRKAAGRIRDLDVLIESTRTRNPESEHLPHLETRRSAAQTKLEKSHRKYVESGRLVEDTKQLLATVPKVEDIAETRLYRTWARPALTQTATTFFSSWPKVQGSELEDFIALHNFRLQVKKLRYEVELLGQAMPQKRRKKIHRRLKSLQTALGIVNDHDVSMQSIMRWLRDAQPEERSQLEAQLAHERALRGQAVADFHATWTTERCDKLESQFERLFAKKHD